MIPYGGMRLKCESPMHWNLRIVGALDSMLRNQSKRCRSDSSDGGTVERLSAQILPRDGVSTQ